MRTLCKICGTLIDEIYMQDYIFPHLDERIFICPKCELELSKQIIKEDKNIN